jgi:hypothetical protein
MLHKYNKNCERTKQHKIQINRTRCFGSDNVRQRSRARIRNEFCGAITSRQAPTDRGRCRPYANQNRLCLHFRSTTNENVQFPRRRNKNRVLFRYRTASECRRCQRATLSRRRTGTTTLNTEQIVMFGDIFQLLSIETNCDSNAVPSDSLTHAT